MSTSGGDRWTDAQADIETYIQSLGDSAVDNFERESIRMAWASVHPEGSDGSASDFGVTKGTGLLRIELKQVRHLDAMGAGVVAQAVQQATAILGAHLNSRNEVRRIQGGDIARVRLVQEAQRRNVIWLRAAGSEGDELQVHGPRPADRAVQELLQHLPHNTGDQAGLDGALGAAQPIRKAVDAIASIGVESRSGLSLDYENAAGIHVSSEISQDTASRLHRELIVEHEVTDREWRNARVDGIRTSRRVLYLILSGGRELAVSIENHQRLLVQSLLDKQVIAHLESRQLESGTGNRKHRYYRLIDLIADPNALPA